MANLNPTGNSNLLLTERQCRTEEYWPEVVAVRTEGQYSSVRLELARSVSSLLYGTYAMLVLNLLAFQNPKHAAYDRFHENGPFGEIPTKKEPVRTLGFPSRLQCHIIKKLYNTRPDWITRRLLLIS